MRVRLQLLVILLIGALLAGCQGDQKVTPLSQAVAPSATLVPSATLLPSVTVTALLRPARTTTPTNTLVPTRTQAAALEPGQRETQPERPEPTRTPIPTRKPTPTATPFFLPGSPLRPTTTPAFAPRVERTTWDLPTPIAGPAGQAYRLRNLSEADMVEMLHQVNDYAYLVDIPTASDFHGNFSAVQLAVNLAAREALLRFPILPEREPVRWLEAFSDTLLNAGASHRWLFFDESLSSARRDEWLAAEIEQRLNQGRLDPLDLDSGLVPLGFDAQPAYFASREHKDFMPTLSLVYNLFGDGRPVYLWLIGDSQGADPTGLYVAVAQQSDGLFRVVPLHSAWQFPYDGGMELDALDLTGDGQPEVIVYVSNGEFGYNSSRTLIYQWRGDHFVEVLHGNLDSNDALMFPDDGWEFAAPAEDGTVDIQVDFGGMCRPISHGLLHWNGEWMEVARRWADLSVVDYAMEFEQAAELVSPLQAILDHPPEDPEPSFADLVRFQLAMALAQQSKAAEAREVLQSIVAAPADPDYPLVSRAAAVFLENYQGDADVYRSCQAALLQMYDPIRPALENPEEVDLFEITLDAWGYSTSHRLLCGLRPAFRLLVASLDPGPGSDAPAVLSQAGVSIAYAAQRDLDGDGRLDWLLVTDSRGEGPAAEAWVLLGLPDGYQVVPVLEYEWQPLTLGFGQPDLTTRLETLRLPGSQQPGQVLQIGRNLWVWRVHRKDQTAEIEVLLNLSEPDLPYVDRFEIQAGEAEVWVFNDSYHPRPKWSVYAWQERAGGFSHIDPLERLVFELGRPQEAVPAIQTELAWLKKDLPYGYDYPAQAARLTYLLGLSYELSGNQNNAVRAYLEVWRQYPETAFALLARARLEPGAEP
ncbi:MAG: tetratricopeptide repeat protein [Chloroflexota bacterium]